MELYYWIRADDDHANRNLTHLSTQLSIIAVSEQLEEKTVVSASRSTVDFIRLSTELPPGLYRLVIEGRRDDLKECLISIDDLAVMDCTRFGMFTISF